MLADWLISTDRFTSIDVWVLDWIFLCRWICEFHRSVCPYVCLWMQSINSWVLLIELSVLRALSFCFIRRYVWKWKVVCLICIVCALVLRLYQSCQSASTLKHLLQGCIDAFSNCGLHFDCNSRTFHWMYSSTHVCSCCAPRGQW